MNERRRRRLQQLASGAALLGAAAVLPGCEKHVTVNAPPAQVAPLPEPVEPIGARAALPLRTPAQLNAPLPVHDAGAAPPQPVHVNSPPRDTPE
jgi:hypothetical protein